MNPNQLPVDKVSYTDPTPVSLSEYRGGFERPLPPLPDPEKYSFVMTRGDRDAFMPWEERGYDEVGTTQPVQFGKVLIAAMFVRGTNFRDRLLSLGWTDITDEFREQLSGASDSVEITIPDTPKPARKTSRKRKKA